MSEQKKSLLEIVLMPLVITLVGIISTVSISIVQLRSSEAQAEATRQSAEKLALAEQQLKILEMVNERLFSEKTEDKKLAIGLLLALTPELSQKIASVIQADESQPEAVRIAANEIKNLYVKEKYCDPVYFGIKVGCEWKERYVLASEPSQNESAAANK